MKRFKCGAAYRKDLRFLGRAAFWTTVPVLVVCMWLGARPDLMFWFQWSGFWLGILGGHFVGYLSGREDGETEAAPLVMTEHQHKSYGRFITGSYLIEPP